MVKDKNDISMAIRLDDLSILECVFHTEAPLDQFEPQVRLLITNPDASFTFDTKARRTVLRSMVSVQYGLFAPMPTEDVPEDAKPVELVHFDLIAGTVTSVPVMGEAVKAGRHMAGAAQDAEANRDQKMEHMLRLESIKAAYAYASGKLHELSSMSPVGPIMLPLIDADELLASIERDEAVKRQGEEPVEPEPQAANLEDLYKPSKDSIIPEV